MKDFTLEAYQLYLKILISNKYSFLRFQDYIKNNNSTNIKTCLIRHDVDRKAMNALNMAKLESSLGVISSYYFRTKRSSFNVEIIKEIAKLGHEIGYHYECLSDTNGDMGKALKLFETELVNFRKIVPINTISMHGRPFSKFDNRDIWRDSKNHSYLKSKLDILGELYIDIDYSNIAYINDTGRNWTSTKNNVRDKVASEVHTNFSNAKEMQSFLKNSTANKIVFQIHPERWTDSKMEYLTQHLKDNSINFIKKLLN